MDETEEKLEFCQKLSWQVPKTSESLGELQGFPNPGGLVRFHRIFESFICLDSPDFSRSRTGWRAAVAWELGSQVPKW